MKQSGHRITVRTPRERERESGGERNKTPPRINRGSSFGGEVHIQAFKCRACILCTCSPFACTRAFLSLLHPLSLSQHLSTCTCIYTSAHTHISLSVCLRLFD